MQSTDALRYWRAYWTGDDRLPWPLHNSDGPQRSHISRGIWGRSCLMYDNPMPLGTLFLRYCRNAASIFLGDMYQICNDRECISLLLMDVLPAMVL